MVKRKVCVVTGSRADYGLLRPLMRAIRASSSLRLQVVATGSHLSSVHGDTVHEILNDGFTVDRLVPILSMDDSNVATCRAAGLATIGIGESLEVLSPDIVVILGDRYEALAAGLAATLLRIPIAHIHGGEATGGLIDEACRHSLTKMSSLHFCATEAYRRRILQLGESEDRVHCVGAMAADCISELHLMNRTDLRQDLGIDFGEINFLVTFHPVTLEVGQASPQIEEVIAAIDSFSNAQVFITMPGAESESSSVRLALEKFAEANPGRVYPFASLGQRRYLSLMSECDVVVGNSSSGLIEAPLLGTVSVNIGNRQMGRLRGPSVIDAAPSFRSTVDALKIALEYARNHKGRSFESPYGSSGASRAIVSVLEACNLEGILTKGFVDRAPVCE